MPGMPEIPITLGPEHSHDQVNGDYVSYSENYWGTGRGAHKKSPKHTSGTSANEGSIRHREPTL